MLIAAAPGPAAIKIVGRPPLVAGNLLTRELGHAFVFVDTKGKADDQGIKPDFPGFVDPVSSVLQG